MCGLILVFIFLLSPEDMLIDFRERGREGEREGEKHQSVASCSCSNRGLNQQPRYVLRPGIEPTSFQFMG